VDASAGSEAVPLSLICDTAYVLWLEQEREQWLRLLGKVEQPAWSEVQADFDAGLAAIRGAGICGCCVSWGWPDGLQRQPTA
jgi:hypothetical protein